MPTQFSVENAGEMILVRVEGEPTEALIKECHDQVLALVRKTGRAKILYDGLKMVAPPVEVPLSQWPLDESMGPVRLRRAIVVPDTQLAYLARLAFGEGDYRVFYNDMAAAKDWLQNQP